MKTKYIIAFIILFILANAGIHKAFASPSEVGAEPSVREIGAFQALTVDDVVKTALENNLSLQRSAMSVITARRSSDRSWNSLLPSVGVSALVNHPTSITGQVLPESRDVWVPGFQINAGLNLSTAIIENIKKAQADYEQGVISYERARQELELQVRKLFYQILLLDSERELSYQSFASAQARYEQSVALARVGQAPRLDELSARVDMENLLPAIRNAEMIYDNALDTLKAILSIPRETEIQLVGDFSGGITPDISNREIAEAGFHSESLETRQLRKSIQSMEAQRRSVRNNAYIPSLNLSWSSMPMYSPDLLGERQWNDSTGSFSVSLRFSIDNFLFFPWSPARTQIQALSDNIESTQIQLTDSIRSRDDRFQQHRRTITRIFESIEAMELNVELAQSNYDQFQEAFRRGTADYQRIRAAGDSLDQAKMRLLREQYNLVAAVLDLEKELNIPFGTIFKF